MSSKPIIAVIGSTGSQGGAVAHHLLADGKFAVRGITRKPQGAAAQALQALGAEIVQADLDDVQSLTAAFQGAYGVFSVTNFWEVYNHEKDQGLNIANAAKAAGVQHLVYSSLENVAKISNGALEVPHFTLKAEVEDYIRSIEIPATFVRAAMYCQAFSTFFVPKKQEDGSYVLTLNASGDVPMALVDVEDVGGIVSHIFNNRDSFLGKDVDMSGDWITLNRAVELLSEATGKTVKYNAVSSSTFKSFGFPGAAEIADMFSFYEQFEPKKGAEIECKKMFPAMKNFGEFLKATNFTLQ